MLFWEVILLLDLDELVHLLVEIFELQRGLVPDSTRETEMLLL